MKLQPPFALSTISQGFGQNFNAYYKSNGLFGHTGIDFVVPYGTPILNSAQSYCYSIINKDNPDLSLYRAVYTLVDDPDFSYEVSYGHCSTIAAQPRTTLRTGQVLAEIGNAGFVFVGGVEVTKEAKDSGSHAGAHLHFQVRKVKKVTKIDSSKQYLYDGFGILNTAGYYYEIVDYWNGYNGCVDPAQFFQQPTNFVFTKNLWFGMNNSDVLELQERLGVDYSSGPGIFGPKTLAAVIKYQWYNNIRPPYGFVGPITRKAMNTT